MTYDSAKARQPEDLGSTHTNDDAMLRLNDDLMRSALKETTPETCDLDKLAQCFAQWAETRDSLKRRLR